jgi:hypothetical protein
MLPPCRLRPASPAGGLPGRHLFRSFALFLLKGQRALDDTARRERRILGAAMRGDPMPRRLTRLRRAAPGAAALAMYTLCLPLAVLSLFLLAALADLFKCPSLGRGAEIAIVPTLLVALHLAAGFLSRRLVPTFWRTYALAFVGAILGLCVVGGVFFGGVFVIVTSPLEPHATCFAGPLQPTLEERLVGGAGLLTFLALSAGVTTLGRQVELWLARRKAAPAGRT